MTRFVIQISFLSLSLFLFIHQPIFFSLSLSPCTVRSSPKLRTQSFPGWCRWMWQFHLHSSVPPLSVWLEASPPFSSSERSDQRETHYIFALNVMCTERQIHGIHNSYLQIKGPNDGFVVTDPIWDITGVHFLHHLNRILIIVNWWCCGTILILCLYSFGFYPPQDTIRPGRLPLFTTNHWHMQKKKERECKYYYYLKK